MNFQPNYCLLDAARMDDAMYKAKELNDEHHCLYEGDSEKFLNSVAPFLFSFVQGEPFANWLLENGMGHSWGVLMCSNQEPLDIYRHLRKFLIIQSEDEKELYFRYYDPRVLRVFLPTCDQKQLEEFFGPIQSYLIEQEDKTFTAYSLQNGTLVVESNVNLESQTTPEVTEVEPPSPEEKQEETPIQQEKPARKVRWDFGY